MINTDPSFLWVHLSVSGIFVIMGLHLIFNPPKDLNTLDILNIPISSIARLNMDTWTDFHVYSGKMMVICGSVGFVVSLLLNYLISLSELSSDKIEGLNFVLLLITGYSMMLTTLHYTQKHMSKTFDKNGNRKEKSP